MPDKRKTRTTAKATTQTTLKALFQRTNSGTCSTTEKAQEPHVEQTDSGKAAEQQVATPSRPPKPTQLFPIFTKLSSARKRLREPVDNTEVIDITDTESLTEPSIDEPTPRLEFSQPTSHSPPPSPILVDEGDANLSCTATREHIALTGKVNKPNKRTLGFGHGLAPLPSAWSQHVRGLQQSYTAGGEPPPKRNVLSGFRQSDEGTLDFLRTWRQLDDTPSIPLGRVCRPLTGQQCEESLESLSRNFTESHPVFAQISGYQEGTSRHAEAWTRRFRPRRANEVLGNEQHALYLRDWLRALELRLQNRQSAKESTSKRAPRGTKRPRVIRAVIRKRGNKKRRVDSDDDAEEFVVVSDVDEDPLEDSEDELAFCQRTLTRLHGRGAVDASEGHAVTEPNYATSGSNFADHLTNTLLITGPPGCGKTAAVYACAEELGWEIFEVYPGIGKRNGASLEQLVGDVGKNHIVQRVNRSGQAKTSKREAKDRMGLDGYLAKSKVRQEPQETGTEGQPITVEDGTHEEAVAQDMAASDVAISEKCQAESEETRPIVRQSLVLLEEVDILFKEDGGFWPAVVELIRSCQRPVVMTCNDAGLVPVGDLPLQRVLVFEPCPSPVAATFLQCLSVTEGCLVPHEDLVVLYERTHGIEMSEGTVTEPLRLPDLRGSIMELQMLCAGARQGSTRDMHLGDEVDGHDRRSGRAISAEARVATPMGSERWQKMSRQSELMSHVDAELCRSEESTEEVVVSTEEENGYVVLSTEGREGRDELIAKEAIRHSRGLHEESATGPTRTINPAARLTSARVAYQSRMVDALQTILAPPAPLMPQSSVFLDYIPWVRYMVGVDDELERQSRMVVVREGRGRCTRNSRGTRYVRCVGIGEGERDMLCTNFI